MGKLDLGCVQHGSHFCIYDPDRHEIPLLPAIDKLIRDMISDSRGPVRGASLAQAIKKEFDNKDWFGYANFRSFIEARAADLGLKYHVQGTRDMLYDPQRHESPA